jgi:hypothetical protein
LNVKILQPAPPAIELRANGFVHRFQIPQKLAVDSNGQGAQFPAAIRVMATLLSSKQAATSDAEFWHIRVRAGSAYI